MAVSIDGTTGVTHSTGTLPFAGNLDLSDTGVITTGANPLSVLVNGNERLKIDASGRITTPYQPAFAAKSSHSVLAATAVIPYSTAVLNRGGHYNTSTYRFTAPVAGVYMFTMFDIGVANATSRFRLFKNGVNGTPGIAHEGRGAAGGDYSDVTTVWIVEAAVNDYFDVRITMGSSYGTGDYSWFYGFLIG